MRSTGFGLWGRVIARAAGRPSSTCKRAQHHGHAVGCGTAALEIDEPQFGHA
jgi:hypothetical protein